MSSSALQSRGRRPLRAGRLPASAAFYLQLSIVVFFLASSSAPTPLYALYQAEWGFSPITVTIVFGVYAVAVLAALLIFGSLSDHIGRRPVLFTAIVVQAGAMLVFATAGDVRALLAARIVQGLATGAAVGALGAGLVDLSKSRGTIANAVGPMTGTAIGGLLSGLLVQYLPAPAHLVYLVLFAIFILQAAGVALMGESSSRKAGALASLRPQFGLPSGVRGPVLAAAPALIALWALAGFYGSLGPALVRLLSGSGSPVLGGLALFVLAASGSIAVLLLRRARPQTLMLIGSVALLAGVAITLLAIDHTSTAVFFVGTAVAGVGFGGGFQGAIRTVLPLAAPHERAGVLSIVYVISYLALGLPAVIAGVAAVHGGGVLTTAREYGIAVMLLAALALLGLARRSLAQRRSQPEGELQAIAVASVEQDPLAQLEVPTEADALARAQVLARAGRPAG
jgi:predicted MFS family arabinose efflux permease